MTEDDSRPPGGDVDSHVSHTSTDVTDGRHSPLIGGRYNVDGPSDLNSTDLEYRISYVGFRKRKLVDEELWKLMNKGDGFSSIHLFSCLSVKTHCEGIYEIQLRKPSTHLSDHLHSLRMQRDDRCILEAAGKKLIRGAVNGLWFLHDKKIVHGHLRMDTIRVDAEGRLVLCDFGRAFDIIFECVTEKEIEKYRGENMRYTAPELLENPAKKCSRKADVWSLGILIFHIFVGEAPTKDLLNPNGTDWLPAAGNGVSLDEKTRENVLHLFCELNEPPNPRDATVLPQFAVDIMRWCLIVDQKSRLTISQLKNKYKTILGGSYD